MNGAPGLPNEPAPAKPTADAARPDAGVLTVVVPADAKVYINGFETKSTGTVRQYVSYGLKQGASYRYEVRVVLAGNEETRLVDLTAGQRFSVAVRPAPTAIGLAAK
jgi:uncharacterized protein (TIGR03000 family)